ncbi:DUF1648 domain-containing protein [Streptomyces ochraceiscleroticus]|uniref:DUF1648 domain-containing protein n=1 Tax=Streptomyces ochraceiscleroticus TaxID=47761 RepID=A0ABW1MW17_9ACTN|nr:DUF1648 domain-containing protein [Streptomyces ochraceiscleroticus]
MAGHWGITAGHGGGTVDARKGPGVRRVIVAIAPFPVAAAVVAMAYGTLAGRLPGTLATHFRADGRADGFTTAGGFLAVALGTLLAFGAVFGLLVLAPTAGRRTGSARRAGDGDRTDGVPAMARLRTAGSFIAVGYGLAGLLGYVFVRTLYANAAAGGDHPAARLPLWQVAAALGVGVVAGLLGRLLAGKDTPLPDGGVRGGAPRLPLADSEVAGWSRTVSSPVMYVLGCALLLGGLIAGPATGWSAVPGLLCGGLLVLALAGLRVTADRHGLTVTPPLLPYPRMRIPLARIREADSRKVAPLRDFGGWGYRMRPGRSGFVLRSGEALSLRLASGKEFVVTVGDAATAAALLNTLVDRSEAAEGGTEGGADGRANGDADSHADGPEGTA